MNKKTQIRIVNDILKFNKNKPEDIYINGLRVKVMSGVDSSKLKIKTRKHKTQQSKRQ